MTTEKLDLRPAAAEDFALIYELCESTMRGYVEADLGDCFEKIANQTIKDLLRRGLFAKIFVGDTFIGAMAYERHKTHLQLEELYVKPESQNQGIGTKVMELLVAQSSSIGLPIRLHVLTSNRAGRAFYERLGFVLTSSANKADFMELKPADAARRIERPGRQ